MGIFGIIWVFLTRVNTYNLKFNNQIFEQIKVNQNMNICESYKNLPDKL